MDLEALLLGIEPVAALGLGILVIGLSAAVGLVGNTETGQSLNETGRDLTKHGLKWGIDVVEKVQENIAEANEAWNDLLAEAQAEVKASRNSKVAP